MRRKISILLVATILVTLTCMILPTSKLLVENSFFGAEKNSEETEYAQTNFSATENYYSGQFSAANRYSTNRGSAASVQEFYDCTDFTPTVFSPWANWKWDAATISGHTGSNNVYSVLSDNYVLDEGDALLFYVKLPKNAPETTVGFRFSDQALDEEAGINNRNTYVTLTVGSAVYFMPKTTQQWTQTTVINDTDYEEANDVVFPAGFEGWVRIPYDSFTLASQGWTSLDIYYVRVHLKSVDTSFADDGLSLGVFAVTDNGTSNLSKILVNDNNTPMHLFPKAYTQETADSIIGSKTFETLTADDGILMNNPDRGFRSEEKYVLTYDKIAEIAAKTDTQLQTEVKKQTQSRTRGESPTVSRLYFKLQQFATAPEIPDDALNCMKRILAAYKAVGVRTYVVIYYMSDPTPTNPETPASFDTIYAHLDQYKELFAESKDAIAAVCFALIGEDGEWDYEGDSWSPYYPPSDVKANFQRIVTKMLTDTLPSDMYLTLRLPLYKQLYVENLLEQGIITQDRFNRIGFDEAAMFGLERGNATWNPGNSQWIYGMEQAPYAYNDAETFVTKWFHNTSNTPDPFFVGKSALESLSQQRTAALSAYHSNMDIGTAYNYEDTLFYYWKNNAKMRITADELTELGLPYVPNWFEDENGNPVTRSVYDYMRDYLGYRLSFKNLSVTGDKDAGGAISIQAVLNNYGYGAPVTMTESGFAILDEDGNVVSTTSSGDPATWHTTDPTLYSNRALLDHTVKADMTLPSKAGTYRLAFYLRNSAGRPVRFDNATPYENGYQILHTFKVENGNCYTATPATLAGENSSGAGAVVLQDNTDGLTPSVPSQWVKLEWTAAEAETYNKNNSQLNVGASVPLSQSDALLFYVKLPTNAPETKIGFRFKIGNDSKYLTDAATVYLLSSTKEAWFETTTVDGLSDTTDYIAFPAGFNGWVRIPCASIKDFAKGDLNTLGMYINTLDDNFVNEGLCVGGMHVVEEAALNWLKLSAGNKRQPLFYTIKTPTGVTLDRAYFCGNETNVKVTLTDGINAFNGHKLYYQFTLPGSVKPLKMALARISAGTHDNPDNVTEFVIPLIRATDGEIVEGSVAEEVTVIGTSVWHGEDGSTTFIKDDEDYFKIRFMCRAAREIEIDAETYSLVNMKVKVTHPNGTSIEYNVEETLADICSDYVDFTKILQGPVSTKGDVAYKVQAIGVYKTAGGSKTENVLSTEFESLSYNTLSKQP